MLWTAHIRVSVKQNVLDPEGQAVQRALHMLHFDSVTSVRVGTYVCVQCTANDEAEAMQRVSQMCDTLLANPVTEQYAIQLERVEAHDA